MSRALCIKTLRDTLPMLIIVFAGLVVVEIGFVGVLREFQNEMTYLWLQKPFFQRLAATILGADLGGEISSTGFMSIGMAHPVMLTLTWSFVVATATRVVVVEVERGTADLLLTLPLSRTRMYVSVSAVGFATLIPLSAAPVMGVGLGSDAFPLAEALDFGAIMLLGVNLACLSACIMGVTLMLSAMTSRRSVPITWMVGWLLASFLISFFAQFWEAMRHASPLSLMRYYRPLEIIRHGRVPPGDAAVLLGIGLTAWLIGLWQFRRRDIPTA